ncbi:MAG: hypothetical protein ACQEV7_00920 [Bacillota bacterium]
MKSDFSPLCISKVLLSEGPLKFTVSSGSFVLKISQPFFDAEITAAFFPCFKIVAFCTEIFPVPLVLLDVLLHEDQCKAVITKILPG